MSIAAWEALAGSVLSGTQDDPTARARLTSALRRLGLDPGERRALAEATAGREDPGGVLLRDLVGSAEPAPQGDPAGLPDLGHGGDGRGHRGRGAGARDRLAVPPPAVAVLVEAIRRPEPEQLTGAGPPAEAPRAAPPPEEPVYRSGPPPTGGDRPAAGPRTAHPRIDLRTGTERPDVVVLGQEFTVTVGLAPRPSHGVVSAGALTSTAPDLEVVLVYDPESLTVHGESRHRLSITAADPYPSVDVTVTASYLPGAPATRRMGVQYVHGGQVVGMAWRSFAVVEDPALVEGAPAPAEGERELLDLGPLLDADAPDLVLAVVASDTAPDRWIWTV